MRYTNSNSNRGARIVAIGCVNCGDNSRNSNNCGVRIGFIGGANSISSRSITSSSNGGVRIGAICFSIIGGNSNGDSRISTIGCKSRSSRCITTSSNGNARIGGNNISISKYMLYKNG